MTEESYKTKLPWILGLIFLVLYLATLDKWVSLQSISVLAPVLGWDFWTPQIQSPLFLILVYPLRFLPPTVGILLFHVVNAILAACALMWLARSVMLWPQSHSNDQKMRNNDPDGLYTDGLYWLSPIVAVLSLGFLFTFWKDAISANQEMLNVFLLAYIVRNTMEHWLDGENRWIYMAAVVYGFALPNNWVMAVLLPFWLVSIVWINGRDLLENRRLIVVSFFCFLPGLVLFLLMPLFAHLTDCSGLDFKNLLAWVWGSYVKSPLSIPLWIWFIYSMFSLIPLFLMGINWVSALHHGGIRPNPTLMAIAIRLMNLLFFALCVAIVFDLPISPRRLTPGFSALEFHFLGALVLGYMTGFLTQVFTVRISERHKRYKKPSALFTLSKPFIFTILACGVAAVGVVNPYLNYQDIRSNNGKNLDKLCDNLLRDIESADNSKPIALVSDDPVTLFLVEAGLAKKGKKDEYLLIPSWLIFYSWYHQLMAERYPDRWVNYFKYMNPKAIIDNDMSARWILNLSTTANVYYLHPSFGSFFEGCSISYHGLLTRLSPYTDDTLRLKTLTEAEANEAALYWENAAEFLKTFQKQDIKDGLKIEEGESGFVDQFYSRILNNYSVEFMRIGRRAKAEELNHLALDFNQANISAYLNQVYWFNGTTLKDQDVVDHIRNVQDRYQTWPTVESNCGITDIPEVLYDLGKAYVTSNLWRQAFQKFLRARELDPKFTANLLELASTYSIVGKEEEALQLLYEVKENWKNENHTEDELIELQLREIGCKLALGLESGMEQIQELSRKYPQNTAITRAYVDIALHRGDLKMALPLIDKLLSNSADNMELLRKKVICLLGLKQPAEALPVLNSLIQKAPLFDLRLLRAGAYIQMENYDAAIAEYKGMLEENKEFTLAIEGLGDVAERKGNQEDALQLYNKALENKLLSHEEEVRLHQKIDKIINK